MKKQKCPKCSAKRCAPDLFECKSEECRDFDSGELTGGVRQSVLCRERCKVAKLKKQVDRLKLENDRLVEWNNALAKPANNRHGSFR